MRSNVLSSLASASLALSLLVTAGCDREFQREDGPTSPNGAVVALSTAGGSTTLHADGVDTLAIRADVGPELARVGRVIAFTTTGGTLVGVNETDQAVDVPLDSQGSASVVLRSDRRPGSYTVSAQLKTANETLSTPTLLQVTFVEGDDSDLIRFVEAPAAAPADGVTASQLAVRISGEFPGNQRTVTFTTSAGSFTRGEEKSAIVVAGTDLVARVLLYSAKEAGPALVSATVNDFRAETAIDFVPARAEEILVSLDKFTLPQNGELTVTATLLRGTGVPTAGTIVRFDARDKNNASFGTFRNVQRSQPDGTATARFLPDGGGVPGSAIVVVTAEGTAARGTAGFQLVAPSGG